MFKDHSLYSGGSVSFDKEWNEHVTEGNWHVMEWPEGFPESAKEAALELINEKIRHGCCGGCI
jgi:hypothetical protein